MPARFMGNHEHTLDDKGRAIIPSKFRDAIHPDVDGAGFVATAAPEQCLLLYTPSEWQRLSEAHSGLPKGSPEYRQFQRKFYANAELLVPDRQGRVLLPERLRSLVKIEREIVIAGCFDRLEIWPKQAWYEAQSSGEDDYEEQMQKFLGGGGNP